MRFLKGLTAGLSLAALTLQAQPTIIWEAFNDHRPTEGVTSPNASIWDMRVTDDGGVLRNIATGADLEASLLVLVLPEGGTPDDFGANSPVNPDSPADKLFKGKVDIGNNGLPGIRNSTQIKLILNFNGLDPSKRYKFRGTVSRGGNYNDRWSVFSITGVDASVAAHEDGSNNKNIITKTIFSAADLAPNQVALNTGENKAGSLVGWDNIEPGADGTFAIEAQQYVGAAPFGNPSAAAYGYGFSAIYLAKVESTGNIRITESPVNALVPAGQGATFRTAATSPAAIIYQWQRAAAGSSTFADISGATQAAYTTPALAVADHESKYRCVISSGGAKATTSEAVASVDGTIPSVIATRGSINFNSIYLTFSEAMKLDLLAQASNYEVSGGVAVTSAIALSATEARLLTSAQTGGTRYTVSIKNIEDRAGNKVPSGTGGAFTGFTVRSGATGLEIWNVVSGGAVQNLRDDPRYPASPDLDYALPTLNSELAVPNGPNNTYGGRFRAWLTPEENGDYEFFIRADDTGEFRISADDKFDNLDNIEIQPDAADGSIGDTFQEPGVDGSTSLPITLVKGKRYAIQAIWKEGNGNDYLQIAWRKVGSTTPADQLQPIPTQFLSYYAPSNDPDPAITRIALESGKVIIEWTGGSLQSSEDVKTWTDETSAKSPLAVTPVGKRFYRVKR